MPSEAGNGASSSGSVSRVGSSGRGWPRRREGQGQHKHGRRECELLASGRYGKYLTTRADGSLAIDRQKVQAAERRDGKSVVHGNDDTLSGADMALGYK